MYQVSSKRGPHGCRVPVVEPENEVLCSFLFAEGGLADDHIAKMRAVRDGISPSFEMGGNAHEISVSKESVRITECYGEPNRMTELDIDSFLSVVARWSILTR